MADAESQSRIRQAFRVLQLVGWLAGVGYGLANIPAQVQGIPFIQVIPAMVLGGVVVVLLDLLRVMVAPRRYEREFGKVAVLALLIMARNSILKVVGRD